MERHKKNQKKENAPDTISKSVQKVYDKKLGTIDKVYDRKFGFTIGYAMGSKSKIEKMKSYRINKKEIQKKLKNQKWGNAQDIISKSVLIAVRESGSAVIIFK